MNAIARCLMHTPLLGMRSNTVQQSCADTCGYNFTGEQVYSLGMAQLFRRVCRWSAPAGCLLESIGQTNQAGLIVGGCKKTDT